MFINFPKNIVVSKLQGKIGDILAKIQQETADGCEYSLRRIVRIQTEGDVNKEKYKLFELDCLVYQLGLKQ